MPNGPLFALLTGPGRLYGEGRFRGTYRAVVNATMIWRVRAA